VFWMPVFAGMMRKELVQGFPSERPALNKCGSSY
jgi:hypothetical protein